MRELVEFLVRALVEHPDDVEVEEFEEDGDLVLEVSVADDDLGRVIGRGGRIANAIRTVARAAGSRNDRRVIVDILDSAHAPPDSAPPMRLDFFTLFPQWFEWFETQRHVRNVVASGSELRYHDRGSRPRWGAARSTIRPMAVAPGWSCGST